ncbi:hypothetical protein EPUS_01270 [Endocarpon pusillum Z07020]|uniref:Uncharacterized protein n=1 Tax=Endocarpon pusillum (strain Z07020 / HMAS-L-300199) TaxID=1263415 RepID=U1I1T8_ENDPU|nr:uncharacterized protein EPUS_01270 [Endocarpon pusillum Z07020]ERF75904.1 hypothetical protein EPUS_01270 [Endocarpon pusillum Z07020]
MNEPSASHSPSPITDAEAILDEISHRAELELQSQPLPTQVNLVKQTRRLFDHYSKRGTATSLHNAISRYFKPKTEDNAELTFYPPLPPDYTPPAPDPKDSRMVDDESKSLVRGMPFYVDRKLHIRPNVKLPEGFLEGIDRIFRIYQAQAEAMLRHHCEKYGEEAIFRVGVRSLILSRSEMLFANPFGLDPETRLFYLQVYEKHPDLNIAEQRLLARAGRVQVDVVEAFWEHMTHIRSNYLAMRTVIAARELRKQRQYREFVKQLTEEHRLKAEKQKREEEQKKREQERKKRERDEIIRRRRQFQILPGAQHGFPRPG